MTTVVIYKGWIASDSRSSSDEGVFTDYVPKFCKRDDGYIVAAAGSGPECEAIMRCTWEHEDDGTIVFPKKFKKKVLKHIYAFIWSPDNPKMIYVTADSQYTEMAPIDKEPLAIGSGGIYARSACTLLEQYTDMTPRQIITASIEHAISIDPYSGGDVQVMRLK